MAGGNFGGGNGTELNPFLVEDFLDFNQIKINFFYEQTRDIDFASAYPYVSLLNGGYDGGGFKILNATVSTGTIDGGSGVFSHVSSSKLKNIHLVNAKYSTTSSQDSSSFVGLLVGLASRSTITACTVSGVIISTSSVGVGGLCGSAQYTSFRYCSANVAVTGSQFVGGFIGKIASESFCVDCFSSGAVIADTFSGGFIGDGYGLQTDGIVRCYSSGPVTANGNSGGFVGRVGVTIGNTYKNCYCLAPYVRRRTGSTNVLFGAFSFEGVPHSSNRILDTLQFRGSD